MPKMIVTLSEAEIAAAVKFWIKEQGFAFADGKVLVGTRTEWRGNGPQEYEAHVAEVKIEVNKELTT